MNKRLEQKISFIFGATFVFMIAVLLLCMITEASTRTGWVGDKYIHKTKSAMYDRGEPTKDAYRWKGNKLYYFGADGAMITRKTSRDRSTRYIDFNRDGSVHYIYPAGYGDTDERYNAKRQRFQVYKNGHWQDVGQQVWPVGMIDWQW